MFSELRAAPGRAKIGVGFGLLLTAIPAVVVVTMVVKAVVSPPSHGAVWVGIVLAVLFGGLMSLAGLRATQLIARGDDGGVNIFVRPAWFFLAVAVLGVIRELTTPDPQKAQELLTGIVLIAFIGTVIGFFRWLGATMPAGGWRTEPAVTPSGVVAPEERDLTTPEYRLLTQVVQDACMFAADVATGELADDEAARRVATGADSSEAVLSQATRILAQQAAKSRKEEVRAISDLAAHLTDRARHLVVGGDPA